jgi:hypothetical protein
METRKHEETAGHRPLPLSRPRAGKNPPDLSLPPLHIRGMKTALTLGIILAVLACGCMAAGPAPEPAAPPVQTTAAIPNLTGTWTGPMQGYDERSGFTDYPSLTIAITVSEQHGRLFAGHIVFAENGTETQSGIAGAIGRDGRTLTIAEQDGGYCTGEVLASDEIELIYLQDGSPYSVAIDSFRRV